MDESYYVDLRVDINSPDPAQTMVRRAQSVVSRIHFPSRPRSKHC
jgi:hypothetical protein